MLYDGDCELCSSLVKFVLARSQGALLAFSALQSESANVSREPRIETLGSQTIVVLEGDQVLERSDAVIHLLEQMVSPWPVLAHCARVMPRAARDALYRLLARNRYRLFGRRDSCLFCVDAEQRRFLR